MAQKMLEEIQKKLQVEIRALPTSLPTRRVANSLRRVAPGGRSFLR